MAVTQGVKIWKKIKQLEKFKNAAIPYMRWIPYMRRASPKPNFGSNSLKKISGEKNP